jgi:hypothetical protein
MDETKIFIPFLFFQKINLFFRKQVPPENPLFHTESDTPRAQKKIWNSKAGERAGAPSPRGAGLRNFGLKYFVQNRFEQSTA